MTKVILTCEFSGFVNVSDNWLIGVHDKKAGTTGEYILPEGFKTGRDYAGDIAIFGPDDTRCDIITHRPSGRPQLLWGPKNPVLVRADKAPQD